jgi:hypothetical protein
MPARRPSSRPSSSVPGCRRRETRGRGVRADRRHPAPYRGAARRAQRRGARRRHTAIREAASRTPSRMRSWSGSAPVPEAQATARAGAVIGRCFVPDVLAGIMDVPPGALEAPLQELVDEFVLDPPGLRGLYDFRHQLLRDALYRRSRRRIGASSMPVPVSSGRGSRAPRRSTPRSTTSAPGFGARRTTRRWRVPVRPPGCPPAARPSSSIAGPSRTCLATSIRRTGGDPDRLCRAGAVDRGA